jgi:glyceraldehyde-3-phosphate dehydrogenase/erythrose-4-phosphate dehydrogenase
MNKAEAQVAMLHEALLAAHKFTKYADRSYELGIKAIKATSPDVFAWLRKHDAEVLRKAFMMLEQKVRTGENSISEVSCATNYLKEWAAELEKPE